MARRAAKVDDNQAEIVAALRAVPGCTVTSLAAVGRGCPDLLVGFRSPTGDPTNFLIEVKDAAKKPSARCLTPDQELWHLEWKGSVHVAETVAQALKVIGVDPRAGDGKAARRPQTKRKPGRKDEERKGR